MARFAEFNLARKNELPTRPGTSIPALSVADLGTFVASSGFNERGGGGVLGEMTGGRPPTKTRYTSCLGATSLLGMGSIII